MFNSIGQLAYSLNPYKLILKVDEDISKFYRSLIPFYIKVNKPAFASHISVIRKETPKNLKFWEKYDSKYIDFEYDNFIYNDETYVWLNAFSKNLEDIREELGLPIHSDVTRSPNGVHKFHITIANFKNI